MWILIVFGSVFVLAISNMIYESFRPVAKNDADFIKKYIDLEMERKKRRK